MYRYKFCPFSLISVFSWGLLILVGCEKNEYPNKDADGNVLVSVTIGTQVWMAENLKTTKYNDGTPIPYVTDNNEWGTLTSGAYCWYDNDVSYKDYFGGLYNWFAVKSSKLCPKGWHAPTNNEWTTLENYLISNGYNYDGTTFNNKIAKSLAAPVDWDPNFGTGSVGNDLASNNKTGFTAYPGGYRYNDGSHRAFQSGFWWSSTEFDNGSSWYFNIDFDSPETFRFYASKKNGTSIRCIKD
jgi:uncharacterized protein (TIGR02145 family)